MERSSRRESDMSRDDVTNKCDGCGDSYTFDPMEAELPLVQDVLVKCKSRDLGLDGEGMLHIGIEGGLVLCGDCERSLEKSLKKCVIGALKRLRGK